jgi:hypothetical protein
MSENSVAVLFKKSEEICCNVVQYDFIRRLIHASAKENVVVSELMKSENKTVSLYFDRNHLWCHIEEDIVEIEIWPDPHLGKTWSYSLSYDQFDSILLLIKTYYEKLQ